VPASPGEYADMLRERGEVARVNTQPAGFPAAHLGSVVVIELGGDKSLVFVKEVVCRNMR